MRGVARGGVISEFKRRRNVDIRKVESWSSMEAKGRQSRGVFLVDVVVLDRGECGCEGDGRGK
jgi:hypothetical protein